MADLRKVKCPTCGTRVIPWDKFPENLHATSSCGFGVASYVTEDEVAKYQAASDLSIAESNEDQ